MPGADFTKPELVALPATRRLLAEALRLMADPAGRGVMDPALIRSRAWPAGPEGAEWPSVDDVETWMLELAEAGWLCLYTDPAHPGVEWWQVTARWPKVQKEGESRLPAPPSAPDPDSHSDSGEIPPFLTAAVGGAGERACASESGGERAGESGRAGEGLSRSPSQASLPTLRLSPPPFCTLHPGGPPEGTDCRDCGTARMRNSQHRELRTARAAAERYPSPLREATLQALDAQLAALEAAVPPARPEPTAPERPDPGPVIFLHEDEF